jgi:hypothetical protein
MSVHDHWAAPRSGGLIMLTLVSVGEGIFPIEKGGLAGKSDARTASADWSDRVCTAGCWVNPWRC